MGTRRQLIALVTVALALAGLGCFSASAAEPKGTLVVTNNLVENQSTLQLKMVSKPPSKPRTDNATIGKGKTARIALPYGTWEIEIWRYRTNTNGLLYKVFTRKTIELSEANNEVNITMGEKELTTKSSK